MRHQLKKPIQISEPMQDIEVTAVTIMLDAKKIRVAVMAANRMGHQRILETDLPDDIGRLTQAWLDAQLEKLEA